MTLESPGFHAHSGWYFRREDDGTVRIVAPDSLGAGANQRVELDAGTWASVIASVSASGGTSETFAAAKALHMGEHTL